MVRSGVVSGVLLLMECCVKSSLNRSSISRTVLGGVLVQVGCCSMLKDELVCGCVLFLSLCVCVE